MCLEADMQHIVGVTELQRKFKTFFDEVVRNRKPIILTRGSRPEAVLIPYDEYLRFQKMNENEVIAEFDHVWNRLSEVNAGVDEEELKADIEAARE
jgi:prevent-host-death family protein